MKTSKLYPGFRFPKEIIIHVVWLYCKHIYCQAARSYQQGDDIMQFDIHPLQGLLQMLNTTGHRDVTGARPHVVLAGGSNDRNPELFVQHFERRYSAKRQCFEQVTLTRSH